jgi:hypothetical protein
MNSPQTIQQAEQALQKAMLASDLIALDQLLADNLHFVGPDGRVANKAADLAAHQSKTLQLTALGPGEPVIKLLPAAAIVLVDVERAGTYGGQAISGRYCYTRVWVQKKKGSIASTQPAYSTTHPRWGWLL